MKVAHRPNTRHNKHSQAAIYQRFCDLYNLVEMPADEWQLCRYAIFTADRVTSHGTVDNYVSGIRNLQHLAGFSESAPGYGISKFETGDGWYKGLPGETH